MIHSQTYLIIRAQWDRCWGPKSSKIETGHLFSIVKLNFNVGLFSCIFWFEAIFLSKSAIFCRSLFTREKGPKKARIGTIFGECLNYKSGLRILIWPLEVPFFWVRKRPLLPKVPIFEDFVDFRAYFGPFSLVNRDRQKMADLQRKMASNQKMQENKPTLKFNFTIEKRWTVSKFSFWHSHWALLQMGKGVPKLIQSYVGGRGGGLSLGSKKVARIQFWGVLNVSLRAYGPQLGASKGSDHFSWHRDKHTFFVIQRGSQLVFKEVTIFVTHRHFSSLTGVPTRVKQEFSIPGFFKSASIFLAPLCEMIFYSPDLVSKYKNKII